MDEKKPKSKHAGSAGDQVVVRNSDVARVVQQPYFGQRTRRPGSRHRAGSGLPAMQRPALRIPVKREDVPKSKQLQLTKAASKHSARVYYLDEGVCVKCGVINKLADDNLVHVSMMDKNEQDTSRAKPALICKGCYGDLTPHFEIHETANKEVDKSQED